jgi:hypothetical protein
MILDSPKSWLGWSKFIKTFKEKCEHG